MHTSILGTLPGEFCKYSSLSKSHDLPDSLRVPVVVAAVVVVRVVATGVVVVVVVAVVVVVVLMVVVVTVVVVSSMVNEIASATPLVFSHAVLT